MDKNKSCRKRYGRRMRTAALAMIAVFLYTIFLPGARLGAQTYRRFDQSARENMDRYIDRATRMRNQDDWSSYVLQGVSTERIEWEQAAFEELQAKLDEIPQNDPESEADREEADSAREQAIAEYAAAGEAWERDAEQYILEERGRFRARGQALTVSEVDANEYEKIIAAAEAAVLGSASADLAAWETAIAAPRQALQDGFEAELSAQLDAVRAAHAGMGEAERDAFETELDGLAGELRREFEIRENFYLVRARNRYVRLKRNDDLNAKLASEKTGAEAVGEAIIADTAAELAADTDSRLQAAIDETEHALEGATTADFDDIGNNWEKQIEETINAGLRRWERAEEDLYARRLAWLEETKSTRARGDAIWNDNHEKLKEARDEWIQQVEQQIEDGRAEWRGKFEEFDRNREKAEREMEDYIATERQRWDAASSELSDMISGGGAALLEAKDAVRYYESSLDLLGTPESGREQELYNFYKREQEYMAGAVTRFQTILARTEGVLHDKMHSDESYTGLLRDARLFAGDLPDVVADIEEDGYKSELRAEMSARGEDFLLYRRDIEGLIDQNELFVARAGDLHASSQFDYGNAATMEELADAIGKLGRKYETHRGELTKILNAGRDGELDDAARLAAVQSEIADWFALATDENKRLKKKATSYFREGLGGTYITRNESDPYLLTRAEYEWELLRRERNYLAKNLRRAEAVKNYADLAFQHEAGLEMKAVTAERARIAKVHRDLQEINYMLIRGDIELPPEVFSSEARRDLFYEDEILGARGIYESRLLLRERTLNTEIAALDGVLGADVPDADGTAALLKGFDDYLATVPEAGREEHALGIVRGKLIEYRGRLGAGADSQELTDRWAVLQGGVGALRGELAALRDEYDFAELKALLDDTRTRVTRKNLIDLRADLAGKKGEIETNARLLAEAKQELERAKNRYRQARIDYDVLRAANSEDLIRIDITNTTQSLASVLHRMETIEGLEGFEERLLDPVTKGQLEYINEISLNEQAKQDQAYSKDILVELEGLEEAKKRQAALERILTDNDLTALAPEAAAQLLIDAEGELINKDAGESYLRSYDAAINLMESIKNGNPSYRKAQDDLARAIADGKEPAEVETLRLVVLAGRETIYRNVETLIGAIRGEERARRDAVLYLLGERDASGDSLPDVLRASGEAAGEASGKLAFEIAESGARRMDDFLNANRERSFAELLKKVNDTIEALPRGLNTNLVSYRSDTDTHSRAYAEWNLVRAWLFENRSLIEAAGSDPDEHDDRSVAEKWNLLLDIAGDAADDAGFYQEFAGRLPDDPAHDWVRTFKSERTVLLGRLDDVLAGADPAGAFHSLSADDRDLLIRSYGAVDSNHPLPGLERMHLALRADIEGIDRNFREIYLREEGRRHARIVQKAGSDLQQKRRELEAARAETAILKKDRESAGADRQAAIDERLGVLGDRIVALVPEVEALEDEYRASVNVLKEIEKPGSTSALVRSAAAELYQSAQESNIQQWGLSLMERVVRKRRESRDLSAADRVKAIIGFYRTDHRGAILRAADGTALVSREFQDLGLADPALDLGEVLNGNQKGPDLLRWAERLTAFHADERNREKSTPEVNAAVTLLERYIRELIAAREIINHRYDDAGALKAESKATSRRMEALLNKLGQFRGLEQQLKEAVAQAEQSREAAARMAQQGQQPGAVQDPVDTALAVLENRQNIALLFVLDGYDAEGVADGVSDPQAQERVDELKRLGHRLRGLRTERMLGGVVDGYVQIQRTFLERLAADPFTAPPSRAAYLASQVQLNGAALIGEVRSLGETGFRENLFEMLQSPPANSGLFIGEVMGALSDSPEDGAAMKTRVIGALEAYRRRIDAELSTRFDALELETDQAYDLRITTGIEELLQAYAGRATKAKTLLPELDALNEADLLEDNRARVATKVSELLDTPELSSIRARIHDRLRKATSTAEIKTSLGEYLNDLSDPAAADIARLSEQLKVSELRRALATSDSSASYEPEDYAAELRDFVLVRGYARARERYAAYRAARNSDLAVERESAVLDLRGLGGDFANQVLVEDFNVYLGTDSPDDFARAGAGRRSLSEYISAYMQDRNTVPGALPAGGLEIQERLAHGEYRRIQADAAGDLASVDERDYFADFRAYLLLAKAEQYIAAGGIALRGANEDEIRANFRADFEPMLDDATFRTADGKTLRERLLSDDSIEEFLNASLSYLEYRAGGGLLEMYLPGSLDERRFEGTLDAPPPGANEYLPAELLAIGDYATADYRAMARAADPVIGAALARIDVARTAAGEDLSYTLSDADLNKIIDRAGHGTRTVAVRDELLGMLRARNRLAMAGGASSADAAIQALRTNRVLAHILPARSAQKNLEVFASARRTTIDAVEATFFKELERSHADLRSAAKEERGKFLRSAVETSRGVRTAYYDSLAPELQSMLNEFAGRLMGELSDDERDELRSDAGSFEQMFDLRSGQELVASGIFENAESAVFAVLVRSAPEDLLATARANRNGVLRAFIEQSYVNRGLTDALSGASTALLAAEPGLQSHIEKAALDVDPVLGDLLADERVLVERFLDHFQESEAERLELDSIFKDPAVLDPDARLSLGYAFQKERILNARHAREVGAALERTVADHGRYFTGLAQKYAREQALAEDLASFAGMRGDDPDFKSNRFSSYRTYIGVERKFQEQDYETYLEDRAFDAAQNPEDDPGYEKNFDEFHSGLVLHGKTLGQDGVEDLLKGDFEAVLLSDAKMSAGVIELGKDTELAHDDRELDYRVVHTVSASASRGTLYGDDYNAEIRHTYFENLANNYLEAASRLNTALNAVWLAADRADRRTGTTAPDDLIQKIKDNYDPSAAHGSGDLDEIRKLKLDADARLAEHSDAKISTLQNEIQGTQDGFDKAAGEYASAARRSQLSTMELVDFLRSSFYKVEAEFKAAEANVNTLATNADRLRDENAAVQRAHVDGMNEMAAFYRDFTAADEELRTRQAVQEYAETPYLFATSQDSDSDTFDKTLEAYRGDAQEEYELALAALNQGQARLADASFAVETQDDLVDFHAIVAGLDNGIEYPPLSADERNEYLELQDRKFRAYETLSPAEEDKLRDLRLRDMRDRYRDVIRTRADHIKHTMRMTRIHKASELVNAEIERRRVIADEKKRRFEQALARNFGPGDSAAQKQARDTVYKRLLGIVEEAGPGLASQWALYNEYRSWYWGTGQWFDDLTGAAENTAKSGQFPVPPQVTPGQIFEGAMGLAGTALVPPEDRAAIAAWRANDGNLAEYNGFTGVYNAFLMQTGQRDLAKLESHITKMIFVPAMAIGATIIGTGVWTISAGMAMNTAAKITIATIIGIPVGITMEIASWVVIAAGIAQVGMGTSMVNTSMQMILRAEMKYAMNEMMTQVMQMAALASAGDQSIRKVEEKQKEYEEARANLEYFTKVPDQKTLKDRMIRWGAQHDDDPNDESGEDLYRLTEEDLVYLMDRDDQDDPVFQDSAGQDLDPTAEERNEALDISSRRRVVRYEDSFGTRYDPDSAKMLDSKPGPLVGGVYKGADGDYIRIKYGRPDGSTYFRYAKVADESAPDDRAYDMGEIFDSLVVHGTALRDQRRDAYLAAGDATGERTFTLNERDAVFEHLFNEAAGHREGGREFSGYRNTYDDYLQNSNAAFQSNLEQRARIQKKEWDLRRRELEESYNSWEKRLKTVLERGRKSWAGSEDRFLQKWRTWERDLEGDIEAGQDEWDERIKEHFQNRQDWEIETRTKATERTVAESLDSALDRLNVQIAAAESNLGVALERKNKLALINETMADIRRGMPGKAERLRTLNKNIKTFNTRLSTAEMVGGDFGRDQVALASGYRAEMNDYQKHMNVLRNVKMHEQYRRMVADFILSMEDQNQAIENQTTNAALAAGYLRVGDNFVKRGGASSAIGIVNAYKWFDTKTAVASAMAETGFSQMEGGDLTSFLEGKSNVEVEAYFYSQRLAVESVFERIRGRGTKEQRESSRDESVIGMFGRWAGKGPDSEKASHAVRAAGNSYATRAMQRNQLLQNFAFAGYGELGATGERPGGAPLGFYLQLNFMNDEVSRLESEGLASAGGTLDPLSATFNSMNVALMAVNMVHQTEVRTRVHGESRGKVRKSEGIKFTKGAVKAVASAVAAVGSGGTAAVALAAIAVAEMLNEDGTFSLNSRKAASIATSIASAYVGGAGFGAWTKAAMNIGISVANAGMSFDERGRVNGTWSLKGKDHVGVSALATVATTALGGGSKVNTGNAIGDAIQNHLMGKFRDGLVSNTLNYAHMQAGGKNSYRDTMRGCGGECLGSFLGGIAGAGISTDIRETYKKRIEKYLTNNPDLTLDQMREAMAGGNKFRWGSGTISGVLDEIASDWARKANESNQSKKFKEILAGYGVARERRSAWKKLLSGVAGLAGFDAEKVGNWLDDKGYVSDASRAGRQELASELFRMGDEKSAKKILKKMGYNDKEIVTLKRKWESGLKLKDVDLRDYTNVDNYVKNMASHYGLTRDAFLRTLLRANGVESISDLKKIVAGGGILKHQAEFSWTKDFQTKHYSAHDSQVARAARFGLTWLEARSKALDAQKSVADYLTWRETKKENEKRQKAIAELARTVQRARGAGNVLMPFPGGYQGCHNHSTWRESAPVYFKYPEQATGLGGAKDLVYQQFSMEYVIGLGGKFSYQTVTNTMTGDEKSSFQFSVAAGLSVGYSWSGSERNETKAVNYKNILDPAEANISWGIYGIGASHNFHQTNDATVTNTSLVLPLPVGEVIPFLDLPAPRGMDAVGVTATIHNFTWNFWEKEKKGKQAKDVPLESGKRPGQRGRQAPKKLK